MKLIGDNLLLGSLIISLTKKNVCIKGPVVGLMPRYYDIVINKKSLNNIKKDHPITWKDI